MSEELKAISKALRKRADEYETPWSGKDRMAFYGSAAYPITDTLRAVAHAIDSVQTRQKQE